MTTLAGHLLTVLLLSFSSSSADGTIANLLLESPTSVIHYAPTSTAFEIIRDAVGVFARGEVEDVLRFVWGLVDPSESFVPKGFKKQTSDPKGNWFSSLWEPKHAVQQPFRHLPVPSSTFSFASNLSNSFLLGLSLIGSISFVSLVFSMSLLPMLSIFNTLGGRRRRAPGGGGPRVGAFLIVGLVGIGGVRYVVH